MGRTESSEAGTTRGPKPRQLYSRKRRRRNPATEPRTMPTMTPGWREELRAPYSEGMTMRAVRSWRGARRAGDGGDVSVAEGWMAGIVGLYLNDFVLCPSLLFRIINLRFSW